MFNYPDLHLSDLSAKLSINNNRKGKITHGT